MNTSTNNRRTPIEIRPIPPNYRSAAGEAIGEYKLATIQFIESLKVISELKYNLGTAMTEADSLLGHLKCYLDLYFSSRSWNFRSQLRNQIAGIHTRLTYLLGVLEPTWEVLMDEIYGAHEYAEDIIEYREKTQDIIYKYYDDSTVDSHMHAIRMYRTHLEELDNTRDDMFVMKFDHYWEAVASAEKVLSNPFTPTFSIEQPTGLPAVMHKPLMTNPQVVNWLPREYVDLADPRLRELILGVPVYPRFEPVATLQPVYYFEPPLHCF